MMWQLEVIIIIFFKRDDEICNYSGYRIQARLAKLASRAN